MTRPIKVDIGVIDGTPRAIEAINKRLVAMNRQAAELRRPFEDLSRNYGRFLKLTGADRVASGLAGIGRAGVTAAQSVARIVEPLGVIAGAASIAGMMRLAGAWANFGTQLGQAAARAGMTAQEMHGLQNAARLAGVSAQSVTGGMTALKDNLTDFAGGRASGAFIGMTEALHVNLRDATGQLRTTTDLLPEFADKIAGLENPTLQAQAAMALFGTDSIVPFLKDGKAGIDEWMADAKRFGVITDGGARSASLFRRAQAQLGMAVEGLGNTVSEKLAPVLGPILRNMADWIAANRNWIADDIALYVGRFAAYLQSVDWLKIGHGIAGFLHFTGDVVDKLGDWKGAGELLLGFFAAGFLAKMLVPIVTIGTALFRLPPAAAAVVAESEAALSRGVGGGLLGKLTGMIAAGFVADQALTMVDPADATGAWIDRNIPGASFVDNAASHVGLGRSYDQQREVDAQLGHRQDMNALRNRAQGIVEPEGFGNTHRPDPGRERRDPNRPYGRNAHGATAAVPAVPAGELDVRGMRNNNPGNLNFAGQQGATLEPDVGSGQRFAKFGTMDEGVTALARQLQLYGNQRVDTVNTILEKFAPNFENDTAGYQAQAARNTGFDPNAHLNMNDPAVLKKLMRAIVTVEVGQNRITDQQIDHGLALQLGQTGPNATTQAAAGQPGTAQPSGPALALPPDAGTADLPGGASPDAQLQVGVRVQGPPGTRTTATQTGQGMAPLQIQRAAN